MLRDTLGNMLDRTLDAPAAEHAPQGADTVWLAAADEPARSTGAPWHDPRTTHRVHWTRESPDEREALWTACEQLTSDHEGTA